MAISLNRTAQFAEKDIDRLLVVQDSFLKGHSTFEEPETWQEKLLYELKRLDMSQYEATDVTMVDANGAWVLSIRDLGDEIRIYVPDGFFKDSEIHGMSVYYMDPQTGEISDSALTCSGPISFDSGSTQTFNGKQRLSIQGKSSLTNLSAGDMELLKETMDMFVHRNEHHGFKMQFSRGLNTKLNFELVISDATYDQWMEAVL